MLKTVYLTSRRFDLPSKKFKQALSKELEGRGVKVVTDLAFDTFNFFRRHKTYGIALAFDFYRDGGTGCGLTLNKNCSYIGRDFAYSLSNCLDELTPSVWWRDLKFVDSDDREWYRFFNKVSSNTKAIIYLCTYDNKADFERYSIAFKEIVKLFADEIVRCIRSNYDAGEYRKKVKLAKLKTRKLTKINERNEGLGE